MDTAEPHTLTFTEDPVSFLEQTAALLAAEPVLTTVLSSWTRRAAAGEVAPPSPGVPRWWLAVRGPDGEPVSAAMRTMPHPPYAPWVLAMPDEAAVSLARALHDRGEELAAVNGALPTARVVAEETARLTGRTARVAEHQRLHVLGEPRAPRPTTGALRPVREDELDELARWWSSFGLEVDLAAGRAPDAGHPADLDDLRARVRAGTQWWWEDEGRPVCLVGANPPADGVARIGPVLTPTVLRGRGYAGNAVHQVAAALRAGGSQVCLFTDQANPVSNRLYAGLGFESYADTAALRVE
ncbi:GNAT family N-acetyltransferase [Nocardioides sp. AX2bis]|uniref:GNAT family N-acetyltransferase n=1 Tax=Nocardioides sp. AX2bis TaxID=2653157 RepID=UPI0012F1BC04|nr:GNAT family N-acetyltransferase [Nocardioides sp. AX2bis]VXB85830.1 conserved hypothetical protein [Nocardioides sp. AX2bis]